MPNRIGSFFHHRHNRNGTHDSICPGCYMTVASARGEGELARCEAEHTCDPIRLYQVNEYACHAIGDLERGAGTSPLLEASN